MENKDNSWAKKNVPWIVVEIILLIISVIILYVVTVTTSTVKKTEIDKDSIVINKTNESTPDADTSQSKPGGTVADAKKTTSGHGVRNIALFGVDSRDGNLSKRTRSDTMIVASVDQDAHQIIRITAAAVVPHRAMADSVMEEISSFIDENCEAEMLDETREIR